MILKEILDALTKSKMEIEKAGDLINLINNTKFFEKIDVDKINSNGITKASIPINFYIHKIILMAKKLKEIVSVNKAFFSQMSPFYKLLSNLLINFNLFYLISNNSGDILNSINFYIDCSYRSVGSKFKGNYSNLILKIFCHDNKICIDRTFQDVIKSLKKSISSDYREQLKIKYDTMLCELDLMKFNEIVFFIQKFNFYCEMFQIFMTEIDNFNHLIKLDLLSNSLTIHTNLDESYSYYLNRDRLLFISLRSEPFQKIKDIDFYFFLSFCLENVDEIYLFPIKFLLVYLNHSYIIPNDEEIYIFLSLFYIFYFTFIKKVFTKNLLIYIYKNYISRSNSNEHISQSNTNNSHLFLNVSINSLREEFGCDYSINKCLKAYFCLSSNDEMYDINKINLDISQSNDADMDYINKYIFNLDDNLSTNKNKVILNNEKKKYFE